LRQPFEISSVKHRKKCEKNKKNRTEKNRKTQLSPTTNATTGRLLQILKQKGCSNFKLSRVGGGPRVFFMRLAGPARRPAICEHSPSCELGEPRAAEDLTVVKEVTAFITRIL
jgi:hypothetical protein